jgi:flavin-binding protein dodecin
MGLRISIGKRQLSKVSVTARSYFLVELENDMAEERVYKIIELVGTSTSSWEKAAAAAVETAAGSLRDLRIAEVSQLDMQIEDGKVQSYRAKIKVSFRYEDKEP